MSSTSKLSATFNDFLFATVCEDRNEMPLSVISALARLDLDPWTEAAELARMPADGAAQRLSALLSGVVHDSPAQSDGATIAARLIALLPTPAKTDVPPRGHAAGILAGLHFRAFEVVCLIFLASMAASVLIGNLAPRAAVTGPASGPPSAMAARH
jgi:hypothetical protein